MKSIQWVLMGTIALATMGATADGQQFYRVNGPSNTHLTAIQFDGWMRWSNELASVTCIVETATCLYPSNDWHSHVHSPVTGDLSNLRVFDPNPPSGMTFIPAGVFEMGDTLGEGDSDERPLHWVYNRSFYMDRHEVSKALWDDVRGWAITNGYVFDNTGAGKATNHPVQEVNWYDMVKWCNARSEMTGLTPCYTTNGSIYKVGSNDNVVCDWAADGYRLPTEAEWEKGARAGIGGRRFTWADTDTIGHSQANYNSTNIYSYDISPTPGYHPTYASGAYPYSSPVGVFAPNNYNLFDMTGNMWEWCWDWYDTYTAGYQTDPHGPAFGTYRVLRGGCWSSFPYYTRVANRHGVRKPAIGGFDIGFRCARGVAP